MAGYECCTIYFPTCLRRNAHKKCIATSLFTSSEALAVAPQCSGLATGDAFVLKDIHLKAIPASTLTNKRLIPVLGHQQVLVFILNLYIVHLQAL